MRTRIKFCGCRTARDVENAVVAGADAVGFVLARSRRSITVTDARRLLPLVPPSLLAVAVFVEATLPEVEPLLEMRSDLALQVTRLGKSIAQLPPVNVIQTVHVAADDDSNAVEIALSASDAHQILYDTRIGATAGGTGRSFDWNLILPVVHRRPSFVAGGLTPGNVGRCIRLLRPYGVDVSSGIETCGTKDPKRMRNFVDAVRAVDED